MVELAGAYRPRGSFRYGPRAAYQIWTSQRRQGLGGAQVGLGTLDVAVARWLPAQGEGPSTELMVEISVWWNASSRGLRF